MNLTKASVLVEMPAPNCQVLRKLILAHAFQTACLRLGSRRQLVSVAAWKCLRKSTRVHASPWNVVVPHWCTSSPSLSCTSYTPSGCLTKKKLRWCLEPWCCWSRRVKACCRSSLPAVLVHTGDVLFFLFELVHVFALADIPKSFCTRWVRACRFTTAANNGRRPKKQPNETNSIRKKKKKNSFFLSRDFPSMFPCRLTERHAPRGLVCCTKELKEKARGDFSMARVVFSTRQRMCTLLLIRSLFYIEYVSSENKKPPYSRGWKRRCGLPRHLSCLPPLCMKLTVCRAPYLEWNALETVTRVVSGLVAFEHGAGFIDENVLWKDQDGLFVNANGSRLVLAVKVFVPLKMC